MRSGSPNRTTPSRPVVPAPSRTAPGGPRPGTAEAREHAADASAAPSSRQERLEALLRDLGSDLRPALATTADPMTACSTGLPELDQLLGGGLPRGRLCEWVGPSSSGRTSLGLSLLATTTRQGHCAGWVDLPDAFDPPSASAAGATLERVLWARPPSLREALHCTERLLETEGFPLVVLDLAGAAAPAGRTHTDEDPNAWRRLARLAAGTHSALVLLGSERHAGSAAHLALELRPARAAWSEGLVLLEHLELEVVLTRHRAAPAGRRVRVASPGSRAA